MQAQAYRYIRENIATCKYLPKQLISESQIQSELGFSRTPVREAIGRLAQEGLLIVYPKRGIMVSGISITDIHKIFEVRSMLEPYTLRTYHENLDMDQIQYFADIFHEYCDRDRSQEQSFDLLDNFYQLDDKFHSTILSALENEYLLALYERIHTQSIRLRVMSGKFVEARLQRTMEEHLEISNACLDRNWEKAAQAMEVHLVNSKKSSLETILKSNIPDIF